MNPEREKYQKLWGEHPSYRNSAPGELLADHFLKLANPGRRDLVYDFGCGTGRGAAKIAERCRVTAFDFTDNCLDPQVAGRFTFKQHDLTRPLDLYLPRADYGYCTDVLEHIPTEDVQMVLANIFNASKAVYLNISTVEDHCGALIGETLHLTVRPLNWWLLQVLGLGLRVRLAQDIGTSCLIFGEVCE